MYCEHCGQVLFGTESFCPKCGAYVETTTMNNGTPARDTKGLDGKSVALMVVGFLATLMLTLFLGIFFMFLFIPIFAVGKRMSKLGALMSGATLGCITGICLKMFVMASAFPMF